MVAALQSIVNTLPWIVAVFTFFSAVLLIAFRIMLTSFSNRNLRLFDQKLIAQNEIIVQKAKDSYKKEAEVINQIWPQVHAIHSLCGSIKATNIEQHEQLHHMVVELETSLHLNEPYLTQKTIEELQRFSELVSEDGHTGDSFQLITAARQNIISEFRGRLITNE